MMLFSRKMSKYVVRFLLINVVIDSKIILENYTF